MIHRDELAAWLRLLLTPQIGPISARHLLAAFGAPQAVFEASTAARAGVVGEREARLLAQEPAELTQHVDATVDWLAGGADRAVLTLADVLYPRALLEAPDPPLILFAQGQLTLLGAPAVALVGSRSPTQQGRDNARAFAAEFARAGLVVVSGLALGVDGAAHEGALEGLPPGAVGSTIAVVGTGLDRVYPKRHHTLAHRIAQHGLMLSECLLGTPPLPANFPRRNRIIAALARGTLVVEAALQSGSLITARLATEMGREVFAIPGSIHSPQARGCHALIKQGAKLVETAQDVLDELFWGTGGGLSQALMARAQDGAARQPAPGETVAAGAVGEPKAATPRGPDDALLDALGFDPIGLDALAARTGMSSAELSARLLDLELSGQVARLPGQLFQRRGAA